MISLITEQSSKALGGSLPVVERCPNSHRGELTDNKEQISSSYLNSKFHRLLFFTQYPSPPEIIYFQFCYLEKATHQARPKPEFRCPAVPALDVISFFPADGAGGGSHCGRLLFSPRLGFHYSVVVPWGVFTVNSLADVVGEGHCRGLLFGFQVGIHSMYILVYLCILAKRGLWAHGHEQPLLYYCIS